MNRVLATLIAAVLSLGFGCSKSRAPAPAAKREMQVNADPLVNLDCTGDEAKTAVAKLLAQEADAKKLDTEARAKPARENFKKVYAAEIDLKARAEDLLKFWGTCGDRLKNPPRDRVGKIVESATAAITYLSDSFPELRSSN